MTKLTYFTICIASLLSIAPINAKKKKQAANSTPVTIPTKPTEASIQEKAIVSTPIYTQINIPTKLNFCGTEVDLTRFDRREGIDREILSMTFMHSTSMLMLKRANRYFPIVAPILKQQGIPEDFIYLMVIESNLNPTARSSAGATGLWQFMPGTAKDLGLEVSSEIDERMNIEKATLAACTYLKQAYERFGNWKTVAASYNAGLGRISQFISAQNQDNALDLYLSEETMRYVYRIMAAKLLFENPQSFGFHLRKEDFYKPIATRPIAVSGGISNWTEFAEKYGMNYATLRRLNPWIIAPSLTNKRGNTYEVNIPVEDALHYGVEPMDIYNPAWISQGE